jgi:hypothetical protein
MAAEPLWARAVAAASVAITLVKVGVTATKAPHRAIAIIIIHVITTRPAQNAEGRVHTCAMSACHIQHKQQSTSRHCADTFTGYSAHNDAEDTGYSAHNDAEACGCTRSAAALYKHG